MDMDVSAPEGITPAEARPTPPADAGQTHVRETEGVEPTSAPGPAPAVAPDEKAAPVKLEEMDSAQLANLAKLIEKAQKNANERVGISLDDSTKEPIIRITDRTSGKLIRQIPPEDVQRIAQKLASLQQDGVLVDEDA